MDKPHVIIMQGLPGSGKTTAARERYPHHAPICRDDIRQALGITSGTWNVAMEEHVKAVASTMLRALMLRDVNIVIDETHTTAANVHAVLHLAREFGYGTVLLRVLTPLETCLERRCGPGSTFPPHVLHRLAANLQRDFGPQAIASLWSRKLDRIAVLDWSDA